MSKFVAPFLRRFSQVTILIGFAFTYILSIADEPAGETSVSLSKTEAHLQQIFTDQELKLSDYDGQLKTLIVGAEPLFTSHDGRYVFAGPVYDTHRKVDIVAEQTAFIRANLLSSQADELFIRYPSTAEEMHEITVVTDIDCPYCRKLHRSMDELNGLGVSVNYIMLPRAGLNSPSYDKTLYALCSVDPAMSITKAMLTPLPQTSPNACDKTKLNQHMKLAQAMKIRSTPTIVLPNGRLQVGLMNTSQLMNLLNNSQ